MPQGLKDLLGSERGVITLLLLVASIVLVIAKAITVEEWLSFTKWIVMALVLSKTVTGTVERLTAKGA